MNVRLETTLHFTAGVFWENQLRMNNYRVKLYMITVSTDGNEHNIALERIKYFIHNRLDSTIFINKSHYDQCMALSSAGLKITTLPEEPVDQVIGMMLYCKLNSIMEDRMIVHEIAVSSDLGDNITYLHCDDENLGPFNEDGWWYESDPIHYDLSLLKENKIVSVSHNGTWRELELAWANVQSSIESIDDNTVIFDFKKDETK